MAGPADGVVFSSGPACRGAAAALRFGLTGPPGCLLVNGVLSLGSLSVTTAAMANPWDSGTGRRRVGEMLNSGGVM